MGGILFQWPEFSRLVTSVRVFGRQNWSSEAYLAISFRAKEEDDLEWSFICDGNPDALSLPNNRHFGTRAGCSYEPVLAVLFPGRPWEGKHLALSVLSVPGACTFGYNYSSSFRALSICYFDEKTWAPWSVWRAVRTRLGLSWRE